jgi:hypothetical protein
MEKAASPGIPMMRKLLLPARAGEKPVVLKAGPGKDIVEGNCVACHSLGDRALLIASGAVPEEDPREIAEGAPEGPCVALRGREDEGALDPGEGVLGGIAVRSLPALPLLRSPFHPSTGRCGPSTEESRVTIP